MTSVTNVALEPVRVSLTAIRCVLGPALRWEHGPKFFQGPLLNAGDVGAGNAQTLGNLPLGHGLVTPQAIAHTDDTALPGLQGREEVIELAALNADVDVVNHRVVHSHGVHQSQGIAVLVRVNGLVDGDVLGGFLPGAEVHEDFICYPHIRESNLG